MPRCSTLRVFDDVTGIYAYPPLIASLFRFFIIFLCMYLPCDSCGAVLRVISYFADD